MSLLLLLNPESTKTAMGLSCNSSSVGMDFLHSFMSGLHQPAVLEWFISTSGKARVLVNHSNTMAEAIQA
jgi:hypothetical protein